VIPYRKFSDTLKRAACEPSPAKPPKAPKVRPVSEAGCRTLDGLGALGSGHAEIRSFTSTTELWTDANEERAAIVEYDGGVPRAWAEGLARLDPNKPPGDAPTRRWQRFIDDCGRFLDSGWASRAAELGWGPLDLFGCNRERPFARIDHMGLLWLVNGGAVVELHRDRAVIKPVSGTRQTYRRQPVEVGRVVLAWELSL
jgi:hypothetical protein